MKNEEEEEEEKNPDSEENNAIEVCSRNKNVKRYSFESIEMKNYNKPRNLIKKELQIRTINSANEETKQGIT